MTLKELSQLYYLNKEIAYDEDRIERLRREAYSTKAARISSEPVAHSGISSPTEAYAIQISELEEIIKDKKIKCIQERIRLENYIAAIDNSYLRQIFTLRFIEGKTWQSVAFRIGGGNTSSAVRVMAMRYINNNL